MVHTHIKYSTNKENKMNANTVVTASKEYKGKPSNRWILVYKDIVIHLAGSYKNVQEVEGDIFGCQFSTPPAPHTIRKLPKREYHRVADAYKRE